VRLIVRRTPLTDAQARNRGQDPGQDPWAGSVVPDLRLPPDDHRPDRRPRRVEADHRRHAEVELTIRELKHDMGINHFPTKSFGENAAWLILNAIAHNLTRWATRLGLDLGPVMTKIRRRIFNVSGRLVRTGRRLLLPYPAMAPGAGQITAALQRLRALPAASG